jgi:hypothetical protein
MSFGDPALTLTPCPPIRRYNHAALPIPSNNHLLIQKKPRCVFD